MKTSIGMTSAQLKLANVMVGAVEELKKDFNGRDLKSAYQNLCRRWCQGQEQPR
jgi:hypothetical protein